MSVAVRLQSGCNQVAVRRRDSGPSGVKLKCAQSIEWGFGIGLSVVQKWGTLRYKSYSSVGTAIQLGAPAVSLAAMLRHDDQTINKSQGQTMENRVVVVLTSGVWTHGMLYVALGRVTDPTNSRVVAPLNPGDAVVNVVYTDVLEVGEARLDVMTQLDR